MTKMGTSKLSRFLGAFRIFTALLSIYLLYRGLQMGSMRAALLYLIPGAFWAAYYYYFVREVLNGNNVPVEERVWYVLFFLIGITAVFAGIALSKTSTQFFISVAVWMLIPVVLAVAEDQIKAAIRFLPAVFIAAGALLCIAIPSLLGFTYAATFIAVGGTIYEWELEEKRRAE